MTRIPTATAARHLFGDPIICDRCRHEHHIGPPDNRCTVVDCDCASPVFEGPT